MMFLASAVLQVFALSLLPMSQGFTKIAPTLAISASYVIAVGLLARLVHSGVNISILIPFLAAGVPLALIAVGVTVYGEPASFAKLGVLVAASGLIGYASTL